MIVWVVDERLVTKGEVQIPGELVGSPVLTVASEVPAFKDGVMVQGVAPVLRVRMPTASVLKGSLAQIVVYLVVSVVSSPVIMGTSAPGAWPLATGVEVIETVIVTWLGVHWSEWFDKVSVLTTSETVLLWVLTTIVLKRVVNEVVTVSTILSMPGTSLTLGLYTELLTEV